MVSLSLFVGMLLWLSSRLAGMLFSSSFRLGNFLYFVSISRVLLFSSFRLGTLVGIICHGGNPNLLRHMKRWSQDMQDLDLSQIPESVRRTTGQGNQLEGLISDYKFKRMQYDGLLDKTIKAMEPQSISKLLHQPQEAWQGVLNRPDLGRHWSTREENQAAHTERRSERKGTRLRGERDEADWVALDKFVRGDNPVAEPRSIDTRTRNSLDADGSPIDQETNDIDHAEVTGHGSGPRAPAHMVDLLGNGPAQKNRGDVDADPIASFGELSGRKGGDPSELGARKKRDVSNVDGGNIGILRSLLELEKSVFERQKGLHSRADDDQVDSESGNRNQDDNSTGNLTKSLIRALEEDLKNRLQSRPSRSERTTDPGDEIFVSSSELSTAQLSHSGHHPDNSLLKGGSSSLLEAESMSDLVNSRETEFRNFGRLERALTGLREAEMPLLQIETRKMHEELAKVRQEEKATQEVASKKSKSSLTKDGSFLEMEKTKHLEMEKIKHMENDIQELQSKLEENVSMIERNFSVAKRNTSVAKRNASVAEQNTSVVEQNANVMKGPPGIHVRLTAPPRDMKFRNVQFPLQSSLLLIQQSSNGNPTNAHSMPSIMSMGPPPRLRKRSSFPVSSSFQKRMVALMHNKAAQKILKRYPVMRSIYHPTSPVPSYRAEPKEPSYSVIGSTTSSEFQRNAVSQPTTALQHHARSPRVNLGSPPASIARSFTGYSHPAQPTYPRNIRVLPRTFYPSNKDHYPVSNKGVYLAVNDRLSRHSGGEPAFLQTAGKRYVRKPNLRTSVSRAHIIAKPDRKPPKVMLFSGNGFPLSPSVTGS